MEADPKDLEIETLKNKIKELEDEVSTWKTANGRMVRTLDDHKRVAEQLHSESVELQNLKAKMRLNISKKVETDYFMLKDGDLPILWVNAWNETMFPAQSFHQMADRIKRINPKIDLIILTYGVESIQQMDDRDLQTMGLYRDTKQLGLKVIEEK
jgi:hypothetical protein